MKADVEWLKDYITIRPPVESVAERLTLAGLEVKHIDLKAAHPTFEIEITSNRPDWLSHIGVAREIAAVDNLSLKLPEIDQEESRKMAPGWKVGIKDFDGCPYYTGVLIEGIEMAETPDFMRDRLTACGIRCINLIVDITNYVLLETGQPLHAFDADLCKDKQIEARRARQGEKMKAIDGRVLELSGEDLVIADSQNAVALAGIMGGADTEVSPRTRNIFLESAYFQPATVRRSSRKLGIASDSSYRFERKVDPSGIDFARRRALHLIKQYAKPRFVSAVLRAGSLPHIPQPKIHLSAAYIKKVLGAEIKPHAIASVLTRLGLDVKPKLKDSWEVQVPSFRPDLKEEIDLIEEIARIYGYENIPATLPSIVPAAFEPALVNRLETRFARYLASTGFYETVTFSLISSKGLSEELVRKSPSLVNPMHSELRLLRPTLIPSLLNVVKTNFYHGAETVRLFEIANVYHRGAQEKKPLEKRTLCLAIAGLEHAKNWLDAGRECNFYDLKGIVEVLGELADVRQPAFHEARHDLMEEGSCTEMTAEGVALGAIGKIKASLLKEMDIDKDVFCAEIDLTELQSHVRAQREYKSPAKYPPIVRDLSAVISEQTKVDEIIREIKELGVELVKDVSVFDVFRGGRIPPGQRSISFRITYQAEDRTLLSEEIQNLHSRIGQSVVSKFQATFQ